MLKKPEPVAWVRKHPDGALTNQFLEDGVIEEARKQSGAWRPLITADQSEAYANERVREALELAAKIVLDGIGDDSSIAALARRNAAEEIRALITKE